MGAREREEALAKILPTGVLLPWIQRNNVKLQARVDEHRMKEEGGMSGIRNRPGRPDEKVAWHVEEIHSRKLKWKQSRLVGTFFVLSSKGLRLWHIHLL